ncbi:hypothetical protein KP509_16G010100 [Ceratopteris richardii]|uniref:Secreted protein n=1 Tax=Ceratopteris richardii TaxID=49495 RepID=A0A8T2SZJ9_CERRI|nr:hypothetical protein KP509_16G010100 [Ceratopteris richardii]
MELIWALFFLFFLLDVVICMRVSSAAEPVYCWPLPPVHIGCKVPLHAELQSCTGRASKLQNVAYCVVYCGRTEGRDVHLLEHNHHQTSGEDVAYQINQVVKSSSSESWACLQFFSW